MEPNETRIATVRKVNIKSALLFFFFVGNILLSHKSNHFGWIYIPVHNFTKIDIFKEPHIIIDIQHCTDVKISYCHMINSKQYPNTHTNTKTSWLLSAHATDSFKNADISKHKVLNKELYSESKHLKFSAKQNSFLYTK